jgi:hypothetical protein
LFYFLYFLKNIKSDSYSSSLIRCWGIVFSSSFIIVFIYSIVSGLYEDTTEQFKIFYSDGHVVLDKSICYSSAKKYFQSIQSKYKDLKIIPFGMKQAFFIDENENVIPIILIIKTREFTDYMNKNGVFFKKVAGFSCGRQFLENNLLSVGNKYSIILSGEFYKTSGLMRFLPINLKLEESIDFKIDDFNLNTVLIDSDIYKRNISKEFINRFIVVENNNNFSSDSQKREFLRKIFNKKLIFWQELYSEFYLIVERLRISCILICVFLFLLSLIIVLQLISIFLSSKKDIIFFLFIQGAPYFRVYLSQIILISISTSIFSFLGCAASIVISFLLNKYNIISLFIKSIPNISFHLSVPYFMPIMLIISVFIVSFLKVHFFIRKVIKNRACI